MRFELSDSYDTPYRNPTLVSTGASYVQMTSLSRTLLLCQAAPTLFILPNQVPRLAKMKAVKSDDAIEANQASGECATRKRGSGALRG